MWKNLWYSHIIGIKYFSMNNKWKEGTEDEIDTYMTEIPEER
jgi:hypothetical protein